MPTVIKSRRRIVSFRVSEEEYLNLCQATDSAGAHSISDFARHVTCHHSLVLVGGRMGLMDMGFMRVPRSWLRHRLWLWRLRS